MDPQQRKLLEVCFECFKSAGVTMAGIAGESVGCFVGTLPSTFRLCKPKIRRTRTATALQE